MVKITRVYTKTGDAGETSLAGGVRVSKRDVRIEVIGTVDELNSWLGLIVATMHESQKDFSDLVQKMHRIQNELFDLGASLCFVDKQDRYLRASHAQVLEKEIDEMNLNLSPLNAFILPGGSQVSAQLQVARSVCRRAERVLIQLAEKASVEKHAIPYVNRLSDWLYVMARWVNNQLKIDEPLWKPGNVL